MPSNSKHMISLFQTATGLAHWQSIWMVLGWLVGSLVTGFFMYLKLKVDREERVRSLAKEGQMRGEITKLDQYLLEEQRINAAARHRLARIENVTLPRSIPKDGYADLVNELKDLEKVNIAYIDKPEPLQYALNLMKLFKEAGCFGQIIAMPEQTRLGGVVMFCSNPNGKKISDILWKREIGGGQSTRLPLGFESVPNDQNCILVGDNMAAFGGGRGQDGEGLDQNDRPVPMPR
jgi:hypothetical protein